LKYFLAVAKTENVNRAAKNIGVSAGSLSKAVARLETELQTPLLTRQGRGIKLSSDGHEFAKRAAQIVDLEKDTRLQFVGSELGAFNIHIASEENLQTYLASSICNKISSVYPQARVHFSVQNEQKAIEMVQAYDAHLAIVSGSSPQGFKSKKLLNVDFQTCASTKHPLIKSQKKNPTVTTKQLLDHPFISPDSTVFGEFSKNSSKDGWRDDKFPRNIKYRSNSLKLIETIVSDGLALAYLPDYIIKAAGLTPLKVSDCKYNCKQQVRLLTIDPERLGWLDRVWRLF